MRGYTIEYARKNQVGVIEVMAENADDALEQARRAVDDESIIKRITLTDQWRGVDRTDWDDGRERGLTPYARARNAYLNGKTTEEQFEVEIGAIPADELVIPGDR